MSPSRLNHCEGGKITQSRNGKLDGPWRPGAAQDSCVGATAEKLHEHIRKPSTLLWVTAPAPEPSLDHKMPLYVATQSSG